MCNYKLTKQLIFTVYGEGIAITEHWTDDNNQYIELEETRKNGQEDCHMQGIAMKPEGEPWQWHPTETSHRSFEEYGSKAFKEEILKILNTFPPPVALVI